METLVCRLDPTLQIPPKWSCSICMSEKTKSLPHNPSVCTLLLPIGARLQMDFGFYKIPSIRGFTCFLAVVEAKASYRWCFLRCSKHPPINLCAWFIHHARTVFGFRVAVICTDGGGELWGSKKWRNRLAEECNVIIEPTGKENSASNGKSELEPDILPWLTDSLVNYHVPHTPPGKTFGFAFHPHPGFGRLRVISLIAGSFSSCYQWNSDPLPHQNCIHPQ
jgi:hypothetical protein